MKKLSFLSLLLLLLAAVSSCSDPTLNDYISEFKGELPQDLGSGIQMTDIKVVDNYLQIDCTSDESEMDLGNEFMKALIPSIAESMKSTFIDEPDMKDFMQACSDEGKGFRMILTGAKSGTLVPMFEVTPEEINEKFPPRTKEAA